MVRAETCYLSSCACMQVVDEEAKHAIVIHRDTFVDAVVWWATLHASSLTLRAPKSPHASYWLSLPANVDMHAEGSAVAQESLDRQGKGHSRFW